MPNKERYARNKAYNRESAWRKVGIKLTYHQYLALVEKQGGVCAICGGDGGSYNLNVDHDHDTGRIRGLLCSNCNAALGSFQDSEILLRLAIAYLRKSR